MQFYNVINKLNKVAIFTVGSILTLKITEIILRSLDLRVLAFFPIITLEVVYCLVDIFLVPFVGVYALAYISMHISRHWN